DDGIAGSNYGWPNTEGPTRNPSYRSPIYAYGHIPNGAITGGAFYNPTTVEFPAGYVGDYFFSDFGGNWIHIFNPATATETDFASNLPPQPVNEFVDPSGGLYYLARGEGASTGLVARIDYRNPGGGGVPPVTVVD